MDNAVELRQAILAAPLESSSFGEEPLPGTLYIPPSHVKALRLDVHLVVGGRGAGKSFWTAALLSGDLRAIIDGAAPELENVDIVTGFSGRGDTDAYPNEDVFAKLLGEGYDPYDIWRTVMLRHIIDSRVIPEGYWQDKITWFKASPEEAERELRSADNSVSRDGRRKLVLFDALDRTSSDWDSMDRIVRGLLRAALWLRSYTSFHAKIFLRTDQFERTVTDFPDASKLLATRAELSWARHDLHGLLWQRLINTQGSHGEVLREAYRSVVGEAPKRVEEIWLLHEEAKRETPLQKQLFEKLAGPWMGRDRRRGVPYTWSVGHLADGNGQTSPRSFLAALRQAASDTQERYPDHERALHYESIKRGIREASEIRVDEISEDYPWVKDVLSCLEGLTVPCEYDAVIKRWEEKFPDGPDSIATNRLPPQHARRGWDGLREDLSRLGLIEVKSDGRIDMPDLYRVGFGLGRKGGVKPKG